MEVISGNVTQITDRQVNTKFGMKPVFDVHLDTGDKFSTGFTQPAKHGIRIGSPTTVTCERGKYGLDFKGMGGTPGTAPSPSTGGSAPSPGYRGASGRPFPVPSDSGEMAIIRQNALTNAVHTLRETAALAGRDVDEAAEIIIGLAYKFAEFSSGQREVNVLSNMSKGD